MLAIKIIYVKVLCNRVSQETPGEGGRTEPVHKSVQR